ncbi:flotillin-like protein FloA [Falseniella ignava]|uniref:Flotillin-like protein FloA n=2 Tax=Falseniella ignava TaxID=137730 RepID=K1LPY8_9LACT|nr:flotillin-like protein FloA [Falseniella ignava]EKB56791.1 hypothetical protein HMPREF9707_00849 [Falseniella ignava CCUG 37419]
MGALFYVIVALVIVGIAFFLYFVPLGLWITALSSGLRVGVGTLFAMRLRRVSPSAIVEPMIRAHKAGIRGLTLNDLESHYMAGGDVNQVVNSLITAQRANIELDFKKAAAIDLAGRDVLEAVQVSVTPKVIQTPEIAAVAQDGIELIAKAKVTVRANIERLVGGAGEDTIIARVGEGIVTTIGSASYHGTVLENPDLISETVLKKGLDKGTAYQILSIDIADIDVGRNIGASLKRDQAEADKNIAQAKAEEMRAEAVAKEQQMRALVVERRAQVVEAEAEVPRAISEALRNGNLGVLDYYNLKNIEADTKMRSSLGE